jgi:hypothetical protein
MIKVKEERKDFNAQREDYFVRNGAFNWAYVDKLCNRIFSRLQSIQLSL